MRHEGVSSGGPQLHHAGRSAAGPARLSVADSAGAPSPPEADRCPFPHAAAAPRSAAKQEGCLVPRPAQGATPARSSDERSDVQQHPHKTDGAADCAGGGDGGIEVSAPEAGAASQPAEEPLKCPLGFGAGNEAKLDPLNCMLCRVRLLRVSYDH